jgi:hypothetical protein
MKSEISEKKYIINGYVAVKRPDHPRKMQDDLVYEHILIAEKMLGRELIDDEQIHHLDFNRQNNKKSNILVLKKGMHTKLHNWIDRMNLQTIIESASDGEYHVEQCLNCNEYITSYSNDKFCNSECQKEFYDQNKHIPVSKEELKSLMDTMNKVEIANKLNTHRSNIYVWLRDYELM